MFNRLSAALLGCLISAAPAHASDLYFSFALDSGWSKQEMQGLGDDAGNEPHFSLSTQSRDYAVEIGRRGAYVLHGQTVDLGIMLVHSGPQSVDAAQSPKDWIAQTGRLATTESLSALLVARQTLWHEGAVRLDAGLGIGFAATKVRLEEAGVIRQANQTVPQAMASLRGVQSLDRQTEVWVETRYLTSPAVTVDFGPDRQIGHETSGWSVGLGVTVLLK